MKRWILCVLIFGKHGVWRRLLYPGTQWSWISIGGTTGSARSLIGLWVDRIRVAGGMSILLTLRWIRKHYFVVLRSTEE